MNKILLQQAYEELNDAVEHYEEEQAGLGLRMMEEVDKHVQWIMQNSTVPRVRKGGYRRVNLMWAGVSSNIPTFSCVAGWRLWVVLGN